MESLLHHLWQHKHYAPTGLQTTDGQALEIIDPGRHNTDAGPDFFNAKIKLAGEIWAGNVEIHPRTSDWRKHRHETNKAYDSVILHVVGEADGAPAQTRSGRTLPQFVLPVPQHIQANYEALMTAGRYLPCGRYIRAISDIYWTDWKLALLTERLERKVGAIERLLADYQNDWNEVFYITLARNFGFGINNDAFERLARHLPLRCILKHTDAPVQVEALFLGQAGLLEQEIADDAYYQNLQKEYRFLAQKYDLQPLDASVFRSMRIRPANFPHIKLVQLAAYVGRSQGLFSRLLETDGLPALQALFFGSAGDYWETHYYFGKPSPRRKKGLGMSAINLLLINTVAPILFACGRKKDRDEYVQKALDLLETLPAERNYIVNQFVRYGVKNENAADSQALIQLKTAYCDAKKCMFCRIGHQALTYSPPPNSIK